MANLRSGGPIPKPKNTYVLFRGGNPHPNPKSESDPIFGQKTQSASESESAI